MAQFSLNTFYCKYVCRIVPHSPTIVFCMISFHISFQNSIHLWICLFLWLWMLGSRCLTFPEFVAVQWLSSSCTSLNSEHRPHTTPIETQIHTFLLPVTPPQPCITPSSIFLMKYIYVDSHKHMETFWNLNYRKCVEQVYLNFNGLAL